jgi:UDP-4-amino-4,6-dideoxy-N-acetyl-beta-L-altrosamine N-acetyltransferase
MTQKSVEQLEMLPLRAEHLELLLAWRNSDLNRLVHSRTEIITIEEQHKWYNSIPVGTHQYWLFRFQNAWIGMAHLTEHSENKDTAHIGIILNPTYYKSGTSFLMSCKLLHYAFKEQNLQCVYAKVKRNNLDAIRFNQVLGFSFLRFDEHPDFEIHQLKANDYFVNESKWLAFFD